MHVQDTLAALQDTNQDISYLTGPPMRGEAVGGLERSALALRGLLRAEEGAAAATPSSSVARVFALPAQWALPQQLR